MSFFRYLLLLILLQIFVSCNDDDGVCLNPTSFRDASQSGTNITFTWNPWRNSESLTLEYGPIGFSLGNGTRFVIEDQGRFVVSGLSPDTEYHYFYKSNCSNGSVEFMGPNLMRTQPICDKPVGLATTEITDSKITITWVQEVARYRVEYGPAGFELGDGIERQVDLPIFTAFNLSSNTSYDFYVKRLCGPTLGVSEFSELKNVRTLP